MRPSTHGRMLAVVGLFAAIVPPAWATAPTPPAKPSDLKPRLVRRLG